MKVYSLLIYISPAAFNLYLYSNLMELLRERYAWMTKHDSGARLIRWNPLPFSSVRLSVCARTCREERK